MLRTITLEGLYKMVKSRKFVLGLEQSVSSRCTDISLHPRHSWSIFQSFGAKVLVRNDLEKITQMSNVAKVEK